MNETTDLSGNPADDPSQTGAVARPASAPSSFAKSLAKEWQVYQDALATRRKAKADGDAV